MENKAKTLADFLPQEPKKLHNRMEEWLEYGGLSMKYKNVSLGQGTPGWGPPKFLKEEMIKAIEEGNNQYARVLGHEDLVASVGDVYGKKLGRMIDPMKEVLVTQGCSGALHSYISAFTNDGDEVVMFEPLWSVYQDFIELSGAVSKFVPLRLNDE